MSYEDLLTKVPNKRALYEDFNKQIVNSKQTRGAIMFIDADNFKLINDTLGHNLGDEFIIAIGERLQSIIPEYVKIYRVGGDEFILLIHSVTEISEIKKLADSIMEGFKKGFKIRNMLLHTSISAGISIYPDHGDNLDRLIVKADIAMYSAKEEGKAKYVLYVPEMNKGLRERASIEKNLRRAIEKDELLLYYQPQYSIETREIIGFEALIRWDSKELGWVMPNKFIRVAEDSHIIIPIGRWVLDTACQFLKKLHGLGYKDYTMAVNLSVLQVMQEDFVEMVLEILEEHDLGPGYSSLNYLNMLPLNTLKIDKSFVDTISCNIKHEVILDILINLGQGMGLKVLAEGVETEEQYAYLRKHGCDSLQGYLLSRPLPEKEVLGLL